MATYESLPRVFDLDPADASLTGFASNVTGASWTLTATSSGDGLAHQVSVRNDSGNSKAAIDITIVGTDQNGVAQTETITGPGASATVESTLYFLTVTSVTPASTWGADTGDIGWVDEFITRTINLNVMAEDLAAINVDVTGTINYSIEQTFDPLDSVSIIWQTLTSSKTADDVYNSTGGATAIRLLVNSYSSGAEIRMNVNQTFIQLPSAGGGGGGGDVNLTEIGGNAVTVTTPGVLDVNVVSGGGSPDVNLIELAGTALVETVAGALDVVVLDSLGVPVTYYAPGQTTMAASLPVAIASNQSAVPIVGASTPADNFANPTTAITAWALSGVWDGATWDRAPGTAADGALVNLGANNDVIVTPPTTIATGQVAPTGTAATLLASRAGRQRVTFENIGSVNVYIGPATVTTANGVLLLPGASFTMISTALIQAITPAGTGNVAYIEEY